jgi:hypothetical protein
MRSRGLKGALGFLGLVTVLIASCSSSGPSTAVTSPSTSGAASSSTGPSAASPVPELVGRWQRTVKCEELTSDLDEAGLAALVPYAWLGQTSSNGVSSFKRGSPRPTAAHPCTGAVDRVHAHFFDATGGFGSLDWKGGQVDDGPYAIVDDDTLRIGDTAFHYLITEGGDTLSLSPVLTHAMIREALADPKEFSEAGWAVSVAYPGYTWQRVPCDGWC